mmetsp:Transcript_14929/g.23516  ORF Transcript_14929/g.23516 Transcript_14929/m.23516 type:complete len:132 (+) Transcript_14929:139-534(+)
MMISNKPNQKPKKITKKNLNLPEKKPQKKQITQVNQANQKEQTLVYLNKPKKSKHKKKKILKMDLNLKVYLQNHIHKTEKVELEEEKKSENKELEEETGEPLKMTKKILTQELVKVRMDLKEKRNKRKKFN